MNPHSNMEGSIRDRKRKQSEDEKIEYDSLPWKDKKLQDMTEDEKRAYSKCNVSQGKLIVTSVRVSLRVFRLPRFVPQIAQCLPEPANDKKTLLPVSQVRYRTIYNEMATSSS